MSGSIKVTYQIPSSKTEIRIPLEFHDLKTFSNWYRTVGDRVYLLQIMESSHDYYAESAGENQSRDEKK